MRVLTWARVAILWFLCLGVALASWRFMAWGVELTMGFVAYHAEIRPLAFYAHVILAPVALALVPFQLWQGLRIRRPVVHRVIGRVYGVAVMLSGAGGLWLAITTQSGAVAAWGFGLLAVFWLATTGWGIGLAMRGDRIGHQRWMTRSIALTLSAVTLRIYLGLIFGFGLDFAPAYSAIAFLCWVPNLIIAELILIRARPRAIRA